MKKSKILKALRAAKQKPAWRAYLLKIMKGQASSNSRAADIEIGFINHMNGNYPESSAVDHIHNAYKK